MGKHLPDGACKIMPLNLPDSCEASLAIDVVLELTETLGFFSPSLGFLVTTTACLGCRACRRIAEASLWVTPFRDFPLMESTSSPFWIVPSWQASPLGNTLWTYWRAQSPHTQGKRKKGQLTVYTIFIFHSLAGISCFYHISGWRTEWICMEKFSCTHPSSSSQGSILALVPDGWSCADHAVYLAYSTSWLSLLCSWEEGGVRLRSTNFQPLVVYSPTPFLQTILHGPLQARE